MNSKLFLSKKGEEAEVSQLYWLGQLILVIVLVFLPLFIFVNSIGTTTTFDKNYIARDLALLIDAAKSLDGDLTFEYKFPNDIKEIKTFEIAVVNTQAIIKVGTKEDSNPARYLIFSADKSINQDELASLLDFGNSKIKLDDDEVLLIKKQGKTISLGKKKQSGALEPSKSTQEKPKEQEKK